ncbi:hypothetical protein EIP86_001666 [Pleurotus ostreatoroseus]|nr:hypothetical protein EIP86_001666 [Pleurotus ostreatoroseus]
MSLLAFPLGRQGWRLIILGGVVTFLLTVWTLHPSSPTLGSSLALSNVLSSPRKSSPCSPSLWSAGQWKRMEQPRSSSTVQSVADVLALEGFQGCASDREYKWHLAADEDQWDRFPDVASYIWTPPDECNVRSLDTEALVQDLVEKGGWLLIGDSVTENHFFSISCLLYPHVIATPNYTLNPFWDRAWPQNLYLNPNSPLVPHLKPPAGFNLSTTPLVTFRRVDLMLTQDQLNGLYKTSHPDRIGDNEDFTLFGGDGIWEIDPREVLRIFTAPLPEANYGTLITSTAGHWTVGTFPALRDDAEMGQGIQNVLDLFDEAMPVWADIMQDWLSVDEKLNNRGYTAGGRKREVMVRAYLPGHDGCHNIKHPWETYEQADQALSYNWGYIPTFNKLFERALDSPKYPNVHFLPIDQPALLRPDAHSGGDCLHLMSGSGVIEGWSHYIWHYVTRELPALRN